jgi:hypothetical protein
VTRAAAAASIRRDATRRGPETAAACVVALMLTTLTPGCVLFRQHYEDFITTTPLPADEALVVGFLGGFEAWDNETQGVRKLALRLRERKLRGVHVETVQSNKRGLALELILNAFDRDGDGRLDDVERHEVRLVLYGMSFGAASAIRVARKLQAMDVPVLLTVQVDSVGRRDALIPPNVAAAANLYQSGGTLVRGEPLIRAEDPSRTRILGNFHFDYRDREIDLSKVPWYKKVLRVAHIKMNEDPRVWDKVEELILQALEPAAAGSPPRSGG